MKRTKIKSSTTSEQAWLMSMLSHEVKNAITNIQGTVFLLSRKNYPAEQQTAYLERIKQQTDFITKLISDVNNIYQLDSQSIVKEDCILTDILAQVQVVADSTTVISSSMSNKQICINPTSLITTILDIITTIGRYMPEHATNIYISTQEQSDHLDIKIQNFDIEKRLTDPRDEEMVQNKYDKFKFYLYCSTTIIKAQGGELDWKLINSQQFTSDIKIPYYNT